MQTFNYLPQGKEQRVEIYKNLMQEVFFTCPAGMF